MAHPVSRSRAARSPKSSPIRRLIRLPRATPLDDDGKLRRFVNLFIADDDVRYLDGLDTKVPDGETVSIIPAVAGG
ncbi:MAG: MoaD/ThiS family protein [Ilumatobacteraceae bacterium]